jgi:hypothetical protein
MAHHQTSTKSESIKFTAAGRVVLGGAAMFMIDIESIKVMYEEITLWRDR